MRFRGSWLGFMGLVVGVGLAVGAPDFSGLVEVGGGRRLFLECRGVGAPPVVLISGKGTDGADWKQVLDPADPAHRAPGDDVGAGMGSLHVSEKSVFSTVGRYTRVCAYDRPDTRWEGADLSFSRPQPHRLEADVDDLRQLLTAAQVGEPCVLVCHSYGGLIGSLYARRYPNSVAGIVMVDAATELIETVVSPTNLAQWDETNRVTSSQVREGVEILDAFRAIRAAGPMPHVPSVVLSADKPYRIDLLPEEARQGEKLLSFGHWLEAQDRLAEALGGRHVRVTHSGHHIYLYSPALVNEAIREVVDEVRNP